MRIGPCPEAPVTAVTAQPSPRDTVVTPLFSTQPPRSAYDRSASIQPWSTTRGTRRLATGWLPNSRRVGLAVGAAAALLALGALSYLNQSRERLQERLALGCLDVDDCRRLVASAESQQQSCWLNCSEQTKRLAQARQLFRAALQSEAFREQQRQNNAYEQTLAKRRSESERRAASKLALERTRLEHEHRLELERLNAQTERLKAEREAEHALKRKYFSQLTAAQRLRRLDDCHERGVSCETLASELMAAAASGSERLHLVRQQERYATGSADIDETSSPQQPSQERL